MKRKTQSATRNLGRSILALAVTMLTALSAHAAQLYWDTNGTDPGAGTTPDGTWVTGGTSWNTAADGTDSSDTWGGSSDNDSPVFSAGTDATAATITVQGTVYVGNILFEEGSYTMVGTSTPSLEKAWWARDFTVDSGASVLFDSTLPFILRNTGNGYDSNTVWKINGEARFEGTVTTYDWHTMYFIRIGSGTLVFDGNVGVTNSGTFNQVEANGGTTIVNGSWTGIERVWVWGTLGGNGSISASQNVNFNGGGTIAPGDSTADRIGTFNVTTPSFNLANHGVGGGNVNLEVGTTADKLNVTGALNVSSHATNPAKANVTNLGGIAITQDSSYTLIEAASTSGMNNLTVNATAPWTATKTATGLEIALDSGQDRGDFNVQTASEFTLGTAQATGYIDLLNMQTDTAYSLYLDIVGGDLSNLTDQLDADGITWSSGTGDYELMLSLSSGTTTDEYLVWDFSGIDANMKLAGFTIFGLPPRGMVVIIVGRDVTTYDIVTVLATADGTATPATVTVNEGADQSVQIDANTGYEIASLETNGVAVPAAAGMTSYTLDFMDVTGNISNYVTFAAVPPGGGPTSWTGTFTDGMLPEPLFTYDPSRLTFNADGTLSFKTDGGSSIILPVPSDQDWTVEVDVARALAKLPSHISPYSLGLGVYEALGLSWGIRYTRHGDVMKLVADEMRLGYQSSTDVLVKDFKDQPFTLRVERNGQNFVFSCKGSEDMEWITLREVNYGTFLPRFVAVFGHSENPTDEMALSQVRYLSPTAPLPSELPPAPTYPELSTEIVDRSLVDAGDPARLYQVMARARRGEPITVAVIGGSITGGGNARSVEYRWANLVWEWWKTTFPQATINYVNAGVGGTGSLYGTLRLDRDLLQHYTPDVLVIEFAVNDPSGRMEEMEGIVRRVMKLPNQPAVLQFFTMTNQGTNTQDEKTAIGLHYGAPMASYRDALWPEVAAGRLAFSDITADYIHPNDRGHRYAADFVIALLEDAYATLPADDMLPAVAPLPTPLVSDFYEQPTALYDVAADGSLDTGNGVVRPLTRQVGYVLFSEFKLGEPNLNTESGSVKLMTPGVSEVEYTIPGDRLFMQVSVTGNWYGGRAEVRIDDREPLILDSWIVGWGGDLPWWFQIGKDLGPGPHTVVIKLLDTKNPEAPPSPEGQSFSFGFRRIGAVGPDALD
jgi:hypothetical protein